MPARCSGILAAACLLICLPMLQVTRAEPVSDRQIIHVLNRLAFGPTLEDFHHARSIGVDRYIAEQLASQIDPRTVRVAVADRCAGYARYNATQLRQLYGPPPLSVGLRCLPNWRRRNASARAPLSSRPPRRGSLGPY